MEDKFTTFIMIQRYLDILVNCSKRWALFHTIALSLMTNGQKESAKAKTLVPKTRLANSTKEKSNFYFKGTLFIISGGYLKIST